MLNNNPSPGNVAGGLLNITIKSLGAIAKAGSTRIEGAVEYAETPKNRGLNLMQGPGYDQESTPGLVAAGATVVVFTTGRGTQASRVSILGRANRLSLGTKKHQGRFQFRQTNSYSFALFCGNNFRPSTSGSNLSNSSFLTPQVVNK